MNSNGIIGIVAGLTVVVILLGSLMAPVISGYTEETKTYTNEGMPYAAVDDDTHTIVVADDTITVDDVEIDQSLFPGTFTQYTLVYGTSSFIRYNVSAVTVQSVASSTIKTFSCDGYTVTITLSSDSATISTTADSTTVTLSDLAYYVATEGDYVLAETPCVTSESVMYGAGNTSFSSPNTIVSTVWYGTVESVTATALYTTTGSAVVSDISVNTSTVEGDLLRVDSVLIDYTHTATGTGTTSELTSTYTYFLAPASVTYDNPDYLGTAAAAILGAVTVVMIACLVVIAYRSMRSD